MGPLPATPPPPACVAVMGEVEVGEGDCLQQGMQGSLQNVVVVTGKYESVCVQLQQSILPKSSSGERKKGKQMGPCVTSQVSMAAGGGICGHEVQFVLVPGVKVGRHNGQDCAQLQPPGGVDLFACLLTLTLGVVARDKLEQLVEQNDGKRELHHRDPLGEAQRGHLEHSLCSAVVCVWREERKENRFKNIVTPYLSAQNVLGTHRMWSPMHC